MQFVQNGQDEYVKSFLSGVVSHRKLKEYLTKIISYLKSVDAFERCESYLILQEAIDNNWLHEIANVVRQQKTTREALELCNQANNKVDRAYIARCMTLGIDNSSDIDYSDDEEELYNQYKDNVVLLKYALGQDTTNSDMLEGLVINLWSICEYEEALRICKSSKVNGVAKAEILGRMLQLRDYPYEFGEQCIEEMLRMNPEFFNTNPSNNEDNTLLSGEYSSEYD
jgi:hypothetical protein